MKTPFTYRLDLRIYSEDGSCLEWSEAQGRVVSEDHQQLLEAFMRAMNHHDVNRIGND